MAVNRQQLQFITELYGFRLQMLGRGYLGRDPFALLHLEPGRHDPYPLYERIRARGPISPTPIGGFVTVSRRHCDEVLRSRDFTAGNEGQADLSLLELSPPDHTRLRRLVAADFTPRRVQTFAPLIQRVLDGLVDALPGDEPFDLVSALAAPLPIAVITDLLGIPDADTEEFARYGAEFGSALGGIQSLAHARRLAVTRSRLTEIFAGIFEQRRRQPADDVIGRLVAAGDAVRPEEMVPLCTLLLIAGFETTVNLIGNTVSALLAAPDQWRMLVEDPDLADRAVTEGLRYDSPVQRTGRIAVRDTEVAGRPVPAGEWVMTALGGANRDPGVFDRPDRYDLLRGNAEDHLSFSAGIHYCLGAPLARLEAGLALRTIATRLPDLRPAGPRRRRPGSLIRGFTRFPVTAAAGPHRPRAAARVSNTTTSGPD